MRLLTACALAVLLAGCAPKYQFSVDAATLKMPAAVKERCDPLPKPLKRGASMGDLTKAYDQVNGLYGECATRDAAKADWIESQGQ